MKLSNQSLPSEPIPKVLSLPGSNWMKIGHLNVHSYLAKWEDIVADQAMRQTNIMCFTETFLKPTLSVTLPMQTNCQILYWTACKQAMKI